MEAEDRLIKLSPWKWELPVSYKKGMRVPGIIYADEELHAARIHPERQTSSLSPGKLIELHRTIQRMLRR